MNRPLKLLVFVQPPLRRELYRSVHLEGLRTSGDLYEWLALQHADVFFSVVVDGTRAGCSTGIVSLAGRC